MFTYSDRSKIFYAEGSSAKIDDKSIENNIKKNDAIEKFILENKQHTHVIFSDVETDLSTRYVKKTLDEDCFAMIIIKQCFTDTLEELLSTDEHAKNREINLALNPSTDNYGIREQQLSDIKVYWAHNQSAEPTFIKPDQNNEKVLTIKAYDPKMFTQQEVPLSTHHQELDQQPNCNLKVCNIY